MFQKQGYDRSLFRQDGATVMDGMQRTTSRDASGRFQPGCSGNPAGKRPGTRNRATLLAELLREGEAEAITRAVIDKAVAGDAAAVRFCAERINPKPRGRKIQLDIPAGQSPAGEVVATFNAALKALTAGEITPAEAVEVSRFLDGRLRVLRAWALEQKLTRWNDPLPIPGDDGPSPLPDVALQAQAASFGRRPAAAARQEDAAVAASTIPPHDKDAMAMASITSPHPERERSEQSKGAGSSSSARTDCATGEEGISREDEGTSSDGGFVIDDALASAVRDQILVIPGVREAARKLALPHGRLLHSACKFEAPDPLQDPAQPPAIAPADGSPPRTRQVAPQVISRRPGSFGPPERSKAARPENRPQRPR
jgi:hypothetical protein